MKKRRSKAGETLVETLVSVLIAALAFALLSTAAVTAARINATAREDVSFRYTAEQGKPDSKRGLGLGLHLCQSIVNAHGGTITVSDHAPSGTTFRFTLPAVRTDGVK